MGDLEDICPVCGYLMSEGFHPHRFEFCKTCGKKTAHVRSILREMPYVCREIHENDREVCAVCGDKMNSDKVLRCIGLTTGAVKLLCVKCAPQL